MSRQGRQGFRLYLSKLFIRLLLIGHYEEKRNTDLDDLSFDGEDKTQKLFENHYEKLNHSWF